MAAGLVYSGSMKGGTTAMMRAHVVWVPTIFAAEPTGNAYKFTLNIQPVVPISISKDWNVIVRTILPIVSQHDKVTIGSADIDKYSLGRNDDHG